MPLLINVNDHVKVKLTAFGLRLHAERHAKVFADYPQKLTYVPPRADSNGWYDFQLHEVMHLYGPHYYTGSVELPFATEIRIELS